MLILYESIFLCDFLWTPIHTWQWFCSEEGAGSHMQRVCWLNSYRVSPPAGWLHLTVQRDPRGLWASTGNTVSSGSPNSVFDCCHIWRRGQKTWLWTKQNVRYQGIKIKIKTMQEIIYWYYPEVQAATCHSVNCWDSLSYLTCHHHHHHLHCLNSNLQVRRCTLSCICFTPNFNTKYII